MLDITPRNTTKEVIDFVLADLLEAESMAVNENNSYRISKTAIQALLARVYHETSNFEKAIPYALNALTDGRYVLDTDAASIESQWRQEPL